MSAGQPTGRLTRADLRGFSARLLRSGASYKADLYLYDMEGETVLLKDYGGKAGLWRHVVGAIGTRQEARALRALAGVEGVPRYRGRPDRYCVAMTFIAGRRAKGADPEVKGNEAYVRDLERLVDEMHARGVVHLDLKHRSNLLVSAQGRPVVLDFESALCFNPDRPLGRLLVQLLGRLDRLAVLNWKRRLCPHLFTAAEMRRAIRLRVMKKWWFPRRILDGLLAVMVRRAPRHHAGGGGPCERNAGRGP